MCVCSQLTIESRYMLAAQHSKCVRVSLMYDAALAMQVVSSLRLKMICSDAADAVLRTMFLVHSIHFLYFYSILNYIRLYGFVIVFGILLLFLYLVIYFNI